jgi:predicted metal-binding membrane protein
LVDARRGALTTRRPRAVTATTGLERTLTRDRRLVLTSLGLVTVACWAWIVPLSRDMYGALTGPSAWMMTSRWDTSHVLLLFAMWVAMMIGMMLPAAAPTLLVYGMVVRRAGDRDAALRVHIFASGYLLMWTLFSAAATIAQRRLTSAGILSPMMNLRGSLVSAAVLLVAGVYQLTPLKRACLGACQSPAFFIARRWRPGRAGAFRLGLTHGWYCLGCCWALMLLLFVGGVMNLAVIVGLTVFLLIEKLLPPALQGGRVSGVLLIVYGVWLAARP